MLSKASKRPFRVRTRYKRPRVNTRGSSCTRERRLGGLSTKTRGAYIQVRAPLVSYIDNVTNLKRLSWGGGINSLFLISPQLESLEKSGVVLL